MRYFFRKINTTTLCLLLSLGAVGSSVFAAPATAPALNELVEMDRQVKEVVKKCTPSTVAIVSSLGTTGSGVVVSEDGLILTAAHVIQGVDEVDIIFPGGAVEKAAVLGANYSRDAGMVRLVKKGPWSFIPMGDSAKLAVGDYVVAMGHAKGYDPVRRPPIRFGRLLADAKQRFMMSDCTLIGGDSGGPLFNLKGEVIGIHSSIGPNVAINNHVPLTAFKEDWKRLSEGEHWGLLGLHPMADPETPVLGFTMAGTRPQVGIVVDEVIASSPAEIAGLKRGDLVTHMGNRPVVNPRELIRELERYKPGDSVDLIVVREKQTYKAPLVLGRRGDVRILEH